VTDLDITELERVTDERDRLRAALAAIVSDYEAHMRALDYVPTPLIHARYLLATTEQKAADHEHV